MSNIVELKKYTAELNVLYVEDSVALLKQMNLFLTRIFKKVYLAPNGVDGLESYKTHKPDLILTDINMPKMDGHEMIKNLKKINPNIKIIIISAHADTPNLLEAIHMGVSDFVQKPIDNTLLLNALFKVSSE